MKFRNLKRSERLRRQALQMIQQTRKALHLAQRTRNVVSLDLYPPEVLEEIASFLPLTDLFNLRFVNRRTHHATIHLFVRKQFLQVTVDFTYDGLQRLNDLTKHYDLSGKVLFASSVKDITWKQGVWSHNEEAAWTAALSTTKSCKKKAIIKDGRLRASKLWGSHLAMVATGLYTQMLTSFFQVMYHHSRQVKSMGLWDHTYVVNKWYAKGAVNILKKDASRKTKALYKPTMEESADRTAFTMETLLTAMEASGTRFLGGFFPKSCNNTSRWTPMMSFRHLDGILDRLETSVGPIADFKCLHKVKWLTLRLYHLISHGFSAIQARTAFTRLMTPMSRSLTSINIQGDPRDQAGCSMVIYQLARNSSMPHLETVFFEYGVARSSDLQLFCSKYSRSLKSVHFRSLTTETGGSVELFLALANMFLPKLEELEVASFEECDLIQRDNGLYQQTAQNVKKVRWPTTWSEDSGNSYARFHTRIAYEDEEFEQMLRETGWAHFIYPYQEKGPARLRWLAANLILKELY